MKSEDVTGYSERCVRKNTAHQGSPAQDQKFDFGI